MEKCSKNKPNQTKKSSYWDPSRDCILCLRPAKTYTWKSEFEKWLGEDYKVCNFCQSNGLFFRQAYFSDEKNKAIGKREVWDFMEDMQKEFAFLSKLQSTLTWEIRKQRRGIRDVWD